MEVLEYWRPTLTPIANAYKLDAALVEALIWVESRGQADAFRHEPQFWLRYLAKLPEYRGMNPRRVSSSYGLMQVMYPVARELGFSEEPEALFLPRTNLHAGCQKLRQLLDWAATYTTVPEADRLTAVLAAYNGGKGGNVPGTALRPANLQYASRVHATINLLRSA
jgi:soluble lytic murein transglycosylase-like protein